MVQIRQGDARRVLEFLADAQAHDGPEPFTTELLDRLAAITGSDFATYSVTDLRRRAFRVMVACSRELALGPWPGLGPVRSRFAEAHEDDVFTWSQYASSASRRRYELVEWAWFFEVVDGLHVRIRLDANEGTVLLLHRQERDFTLRDRLVASFLRPHVIALTRRARERRSLAALRAAVDSSAESDSRGVVLMGSGDSIEYASPAARRLLAEWFGEAGPRLPAALSNRVAAPSREARFQLAGAGKRLVARALTRDALFLEEESTLRDSLTVRELEVVRCVAAGKSTAEIAREFWLSPTTVSKHLEHVYRKLGVTSRTAALAALGVKFESRRIP
jgi:DNA-binding CsgD family transcriptional regulator